MSRMQLNTRGAPSRTCIGCRQVTAPSDLVRLVLADDGRLLAMRRRGSFRGRGASLHPSEDCARAAFDRNAQPLARAFRGAVPRAVVEAGVSQVVTQLQNASLFQQGRKP